MEAKLVQLCLLFAVVVIGSSYAFGHHRGRDDYYPRQYQQHGYYQGQPRGYMHGSVYPRRHLGDMSSSDEEELRRRYRHHDTSSSDEEEHESSSDEEEQEHDHHDEKIWRFQISQDMDAYSYTDEHGEVHGFLIDLMRAVCDKAHKRCYFIVDSGSHCWRTEGERELPGVGLLDHYYDACLGYWQSTTRKNSFNFTLPFSRDVSASLHYKAGAKPENANVVTDTKVGFMAGWPINKKCFERQSGFTGNSPGKYIPVQFETWRGMMAAIESGEVNSIVTINSHKDDELGIEHVEPNFHCTIAGGSVMTMYGSEVIDWWNSAFVSMKADGSFRSLCNRSASEHSSHGVVNCVDY